jgi:plastocyanin
MKTNHKSILALAGVAALVALLSVPVMSDNAEPQAKAASDVAPVLQPRTVIVAGNEDPQFGPKQLTITAGEEVKFFNVDGFNGVGRVHQIVSVDAQSGIPNGVFDTGVLSRGGSATIKITEPGVYGFIDQLWPATQGTITVVP